MGWVTMSECEHELNRVEVLALVDGVRLPVTTALGQLIYVNRRFV